MINMEKLGALMEKFSTPEPAAPAEPVASEAPAEVVEVVEGGESTGEVAEGAAPVETAETPPAPEAPQDKAAAKFAALAKREKALRAERANADAATKAREEALAKREADIEARMKALEEHSAKTSKIAHPIEALKAHGFSYQDAFEAVTGGYTPPEKDPLDEKLSPLQQKIAEMEREKEELKKVVEEERKARLEREHQQQFHQFVDAIKQEVARDAEKYELISQMGDKGVDLVKETIYAHYAKHNKSPTYAEACEWVEEWLEANYVEPFLKTKKVAAKVAPVAPKPQAAQPKAPPKATAPKAIPASLGSPAATPDRSKMTREDRLKHLINKYNK